MKQLTSKSTSALVKFAIIIGFIAYFMVDKLNAGSDNALSNTLLAIEMFEENKTPTLTAGDCVQALLHDKQQKTLSTTKDACVTNPSRRKR
jgi:hypothetical protein